MDSVHSNSSPRVTYLAVTSEGRVTARGPVVPPARLLLLGSHLVLPSVLQPPNWGAGSSEESELVLPELAECRE